MIVVAGVGNVLFGDDGFGPAVVAAIGAGTQGAHALGADVRVVDVGIRGVHLAFDVADGVDDLVVVDLVALPDAAGTVVVLDPDVEEVEPRAVDGHGADVAATVALARRIGAGPTRVRLVGCVPAGCAPGVGLSAPVAAAVEVAASVVADLVGRLRREPVPCSDG